ncbi:MAG TPA: hypothetical protein PLJ33_05590 [Peptococcaceae bacterium]|jgi:hypothetical protein|nr:hypothetical protein [Clostridia bacterium]HOB82361.1 hypothetical protein [Peptococcaceae bacterium]HPZ71192.1 hypothetical protein [Peptococcaceae bacterium]HQD54317.1 hypothetical protein [Peptococcaceae bacterium]
MGSKRPVFLLSILDPQRSLWKWALLLLAVFFLLYGGRYIYEEANRLPPDEAVKQCVLKALNAESYRFQVTAKRIQDGQETVISEINGEKSLAGVHLYGSLPLIKADVEIYHLGDQMYQKDVYTKKWILIPAQSREGIEQLIAELNPLSIFNFSEDNWEIKEAGKERIDGKGCYVYEVMTRGENKYLQLFWKDFNYILWVDKKEGLLRQAKISAEHRERSDHRLTIEVKLTDYNVPIELTPPV